MKSKFLVALFILQSCFVFCQTKTPVFFKWQNNKAIKNAKKHLQFDTLINTDDAILHVYFSNKKNKPYLMLLHGLGGNGRANWVKQIKVLSKHFNLIVPDLVYFGESTSLSVNYTVDFQVKQLNNLIEKLHILQPINLLGFSYGGLTAALFNEKHHDKIKKLIIVDGPVKFFSNVEADSLAQSYGVKSMYNIISPSTVDEYKAMQTAALSSALPTTKKIKQKIIAYVFDTTRATRTLQMDAMRQYQNTYQAYNYNLDKTQTLLLWGAKDGVVPLSVGKRLNNAFAQTTKLIVFAKAKHDAHFSYSKHFNQAIIEFLK